MDSPPFEIGDVVRVNRPHFSYHGSLGIIQYCPMVNPNAFGYDIQLINGTVIVLYPGEINLVDKDG